MANNFTLAGMRVAMTAYTDKGERSKRLEIRVVPNMSAVPLIIDRSGFHGK